MMALAMVVIASMIGVQGLGLPVLRAISNQYLALGLMNGLAIVVLAIIFDRVTQRIGKRIRSFGLYWRNCSINLSRYFKPSHSRHGIC